MSPRASLTTKVLPSRILTRSVSHCGAPCSGAGSAGLVGMRASGRCLLRLSARPAARRPWRSRGPRRSCRTVVGRRAGRNRRRPPCARRRRHLFGGRRASARPPCLRRRRTATNPKPFPALADGRSLRDRSKNFCRRRRINHRVLPRLRPAGHRQGRYCDAPWGCSPQPGGAELFPERDDDAMPTGSTNLIQRGAPTCS